jgi:REP element-mobilizing transposase RayT
MQIHFFCKDSRVFGSYNQKPTEKIDKKESMNTINQRQAIHFLFGTRGNKPLIRESMQKRLWSYMGGICRQMKIEVHEIGGDDNHAHLLLSLPPHISPGVIMQNVKSISSRWMNSTFYPGKRVFRWQSGYLAHSVPPSELALYRSYIRNQKKLHQKTPFEAEFERLEKVIKDSKLNPVQRKKGAKPQPVS